MPIETTWGRAFPQKPKAPENFKKTLKEKYGITTAEELKRKVDLILHKNKIRTYEYEEESFGPSVESKYFWIVDFLNNMKYKVEKHWEKLGASVVSQFFGEMSTRRQFLEKRGMEIMATINTVVRTIINLLYDLREIDRRLNTTYELLKSKDPKEVANADMALKRIWMDEVDIRKGGASLNNMAQKGLEFITIRDAFLIAKDVKEVDELQLNERVKRILKMRIAEYEDWKKESEKELRMRKRIERAYLLSEVESLKLYSKWARPYLQAAQRLQFEDVKLTDPELIQAFDQNFIELKIRGKKEYRLKSFFAKASVPRDFTPPASWSEEMKEAYKNKKFGPPVYGVMDVTFQYRTKPALVSQTQSGGIYRNLGKLNIKFESYFLTPEEYKLLDRQEESEALKFIEGMTKETLDAMQEDINHYLEEEKEERGKEKPKEKEADKPKQKPLLEQWLGSWNTGGVGSGWFSLFDKAKYTQAMLSARAKIAEDAFTVYDIFKKSQGLLSFPYYPSYATPKAGK